MEQAQSRGVNSLGPHIYVYLRSFWAELPAKAPGPAVQAGRKFPELLSVLQNYCTSEKSMAHGEGRADDISCHNALSFFLTVYYKNHVTASELL
jgi:hypothetical protein